MNWFVTVVLSCTVAWTSNAHADAPLATGLRACAAGDTAACGRLEAALQARFAAGTNGGDRLVAHTLALAASRLIHGDAPPTSVASDRRIVVDTVRTCRAGDAEACNRLANVLAGLFTGADARLDASSDRVLARAFASSLLAIATHADGPLLGLPNVEAQR